MTPSMATAILKSEVPPPAPTSGDHRAESAKPKSGTRGDKLTGNSQTTNFKAEALTDEHLRLEAPSIFAQAPMSGLSQRYAFIPTTRIVSGLREKNWLPVHVEQQRVRTAPRIGFQKHLIRFRREEQMQTLDEWNVELVLTNSHDAACAYIMRVGIYHRLCSNGLVISDEAFDAIRFRHSGLAPEEIVQASYRVLEYIPRVGSFIDRFRNRQISDPEAVGFAEKALALRFENLDEAPISPRALLNARRPEDQATDLWTVYNRVQENLVRGGITENRISRAGRRRTLRALRGIDSKVVLNKQLWNLAEAMANARN